jgi:hypothetical protein
MIGGFPMFPEPMVLGTEAEMPGYNRMKEFRLGDKIVCVANVDGVILAIEKNWLNGDGPFGSDSKDGSSSISTSTGWRWAPRAGGEHSAGIAVYPVKVENNQVLIQLHMAEWAVTEKISDAG